MVGQTGMRVSVQLSKDELSRMTASRVNECVIDESLIEGCVRAHNALQPLG